MSEKRILIVVTDLKESSAQYGVLFETLKSQAGWAHYLKSTWFLATDKTAHDVYREIKPHILGKDRIFIAEMGDSHSRHGWLPKKAWAWLKRHEKS